MRARGQLVGHAGGERRLGTDDDEVVALARGVAGDRLGIGRVEVDVLADGRRPAVARGRSDEPHALVAGQPPRERVLARPGTEDEDVHYGLPSAARASSTAASSSIRSWYVPRSPSASASCASA